MKTDYDIIIVGGGMVGLALAAKLVKNPASKYLNIAIVDPNPVEPNSVDSNSVEPSPVEMQRSETVVEKLNYDMRVSAITRASEMLFRDVGAWDFIGEQEKSAYQKMYVWDGESSRGKIEFDSSLLAEPNLGHIIENRVLRRSLFQVIEKQKNIDWLCPQTCEQVEYHDDFAQLVLKSGKTINAKLLVAADGAFSWLRQNSGIDLQAKAYNHKAIVCTLKTEKPHQQTAYQRFDHNGPLAFLPLKNSHVCSIVWSINENLAEHLLSLDDEQFKSRIGQVFEHHLGQIEAITKRVAFPLFERTAEHLIGNRLALIGDAAHTIHPLAGQGVNLGFTDAQILAQTIIQTVDKNKDIGLKLSLRSYERARKGEIFAMQKAMLGFKKLFEQQTPFVQMARSYGMNLADQHPLLKQQLIKKAMGL